MGDTDHGAPAGRGILLLGLSLITGRTEQSWTKVHTLHARCADISLQLKINVVQKSHSYGVILDVVNKRWRKSITSDSLPALNCDLRLGEGSKVIFVAENEVN